MTPEYAKFKANFLLNDFSGLLNRFRVRIDNCGISGIAFDIICLLLYSGFITRQQAREICEYWIKNMEGLKD